MKFDVYPTLIIPEGDEREDSKSLFQKKEFPFQFNNSIQDIIQDNSAPLYTRHNNFYLHLYGLYRVVQICIDEIRTSDKSDFNFEKTENCASVFKTVDREIF